MKFRFIRPVLLAAMTFDAMSCSTDEKPFVVPLQTVMPNLAR